MRGSSLELYNEIKEVLDKSSLNYEEIHYPPFIESKSVDFIVQRGSKPTLMRVSNSISTRRKDYLELRKLLAILRVSGLIVTKKFNKEDVIDNVVYIRGRIAITSPTTFRNFLRGEKIFVYEYKGSLYVKVDGIKLRQLRERYRLSLSRLASIVGVSTKALYQYEQEEMDMSVETAEKFAEVFGDEFEDTLKNIDIFDERIIDEKEEAIHIVPNSDVSNSKQKVMYAAIKKGIRAETFEYLPSDVVLDVGVRKAFIILISRWISKEHSIMKCVDSMKLARAVKGLTLALVDDRDNLEQELVHELESFVEVRRLTELNEMLNELIKESRR